MCVQIKNECPGHFRLKKIHLYVIMSLLDKQRHYTINVEQKAASRPKIWMLFFIPIVS